MKEATLALAKFFYVIAALSLVFALVCFAMAPNNTNGSTEREYTYGGDAYTGMQNAAAQAATNAYYVNQNIAALITHITNIAGFAFVITGVAFAGVAYVKSKEAASYSVNQLPDVAQTSETATENAENEVAAS